MLKTVDLSESKDFLSKIGKIVDAEGSATIEIDGTPRYVVSRIDESKASRDRCATEEEALKCADEIMDQFEDAFRELAK